MQLTLAEIAETMGAPALAMAALVDGYSIDSRTIKPGELFFAIHGERFDGHDFVLNALAAGAVGAVVDGAAFGRFAESFRSRLLPVLDTLQALQALAGGVRRRWGRPLVAVTGSAGKTTTKEMIARVLSARWRVHKSEANLNNQYGLPLSLLRLTPGHDAAVMELGMNHAGELTRLAELCRPETGVVTNVLPVHLEFFDSIEGIAEAKRELVRALPADGLAVLNATDARVARFGDGYSGQSIFYGSAVPSRTSLWYEKFQPLGLKGSECEVYARPANGDEGEHTKLRLPLLGEHNALNALAALAVGQVFGIGLEEGAGALASIRPLGGRGQWRERSGITVIDDCYNSNPGALERMTVALLTTPGTRHFIVAGEMLELGPTSGALHRGCGERMAELDRRGRESGGARLDGIFGIRGDAAELIAGARAAGFAGAAEFFDTPEAGAAALRGRLQAGDTVLVKGSRGVHLERLLAALGLE